jgi:hypothetical protein
VPQLPHNWHKWFEIITGASFGGSCRFITMFTRACHSFLSWASWIQPTPSMIFLQDAFYYSPPIYAWVFQVVSSAWIIQPKLYIHLSSLPYTHTTCPTHLLLLDMISLITSVEEYKLWSSPLCTSVQHPVLRNPQSVFSPYGERL